MPTAEVPVEETTQQSPEKKKKAQPMTLREANKILTSSLTPLQANFRAARKVNTPLVAITSSDPAITVRTIMEATKEPRTKGNGDSKEVILAADGSPIYEEVPAVQWDVVRGLQPVNQLGVLSMAQVLGLPIGDAPDMDKLESDARKKGALMVNPSEMLRKAEAMPAKTIVFMVQAHRYLEGNDSNMKIVAQGIWSLRDEFKTDYRQLVMIAPALTLPIEIQQDVMMLDEPLPNETALDALANKLLRASGARNDDGLVSSIISATMGLSAFAAEQAIARAFKRDETGEIYLDVKDCQERKRSIIDSTPGLKLYTDVPGVEDMAGNQNVLEFVKRYMEYNEIRSIAWIDEIEKVFSGAMTDTSGVSGEMLGVMLTWMEERKVTGLIFLGPPGSGKSHMAKIAGSIKQIPTIGMNLGGMKASLVGESNARLANALKVIDAVSGGPGRTLAIATSNNIDSIPPELLARFRLGTFFFDLPDAEEKRAMWDLYKRKNKLPADMPTPNDEGWAGRDIAKCVENAACLKMSLVDAAKFVVSVSQTSGDKITRLRQNADGRYISANYPGAYRYNEEATTQEARKQFAKLNPNERKFDIM